VFAIVVTFKLKPGSAAAFNPVMLENAEASVRDEPGCHQFQVLHDEADPDTIVLYEVYDDDAAFEAHKQTPHFEKFGQEGMPMVEEADIQRLTLLKA
jgi:(4S)-4-hydroxy-5-phosphonooxypentane-2,3-dione isomerase